MRITNFLIGVLLISCAPSRLSKNVSVIHGDNPGSLTYLSKDELINEVKLRKSLSDEDMEVEAHILPKGGKLLYRWSNLGGSAYMEKMTLEYRGIVQECKNPNVNAMALEQRSNIASPVLFTIHKSKLEVDCPLRYEITDSLIVKIYDDSEKEAARFRVTAQQKSKGDN